MTCEPWQASAYHEDLRWRIVWQSEALGLSTSNIAINLNIDKSTVKRILNTFTTTGTVTKKPYPAENAFRIITEPVKFFIFHLVLQKPGILLREITKEIKETLGITVSESAICKVLVKGGFTHQKLAVCALQRDDALRGQFKADVCLYTKESIVFVDETGTNTQDAIRTHGYSLKGKVLKAEKLLVKGEHVSAMVAMSMQGILSLQILRGSVDGDNFYDFICKLLPHLMPYNGTNEHSVLIMDNRSIHHVEEIDEVLQDAQILAHYLPPYSPDYNPIEFAFSKVKYMIKAMEAEVQAIDDIDTIILHAFATITVNDCQNWIKSCGIYN